MLPVSPRIPQVEALRPFGDINHQNELHDVPVKRFDRLPAVVVSDWFRCAGIFVTCHVISFL